MTSPYPSASPSDTRRHAASFASQLGPGSAIRLLGDLGAGKTEWVKGLAAALGFPGDVTSPTFALLHEYRGGSWPIFHWDLYRLNPNTDWHLLDLPDHLAGSGITIVEWPDRYPGPWPRGCREIRIEMTATGRLIHLSQDD